jgi:hypothetical protein
MNAVSIQGELVGHLVTHRAKIFSHNDLLDVGVEREFYDGDRQNSYIAKLFFFSRRVLLCSPGWPRTLGPPASIFWVLELQVYVTMPVCMDTLLTQELIFPSLVVPGTNMAHYEVHNISREVSWRKV